MPLLKRVRSHLHLLSEVKKSEGFSGVIRWEVMCFAGRLGLWDHVHLLAGLMTSVGLFAAIRWEVLRFAVTLGVPEPAMWRLRPRQVKHAVQVRLHGSSDLRCFDQIFMFEEYSILENLREPLLIFDLGANVGFSSAYFLNKFPKARVVAVEPEEGNLALCKANLSPYGERVLLTHGAVWSKNATLRLLNAYRDGREWSTQVGEFVDGKEMATGVKAWDVGTLMDLSGGEVVDLLKVDIERAEVEVFGISASRWLHRVRNICIELHGKDCEEVFFAALEDFDYVLEHSGELTICRNLRSKNSANMTVGQAQPRDPAQQITHEN
jgi:FkbM family methyltransferase